VLQVVVAFHRVRTGHGNPGKSWDFILAFSGTGISPGKLMQVLESPGILFWHFPGLELVLEN